MIRDHRGRAAGGKRNILKRRWGCYDVSLAFNGRQGGERTYDWAETAATAAAPMKAEVILTILIDLILVCILVG